MTLAHRSAIFGKSIRLAAVFSIAVAALSGTATLAQTPEGDATPFTGAAGDGPHPAHIHLGTCDELGEVVVPLADVGSEAGEVVGPESAHPVKTSRNVVDMPLEEIIAGGHAINVHLSVEEIDVYIACGDIGGELIVDDDGRTHLQIGLGELNDSGHTGIAWLGSDGDQTEVVINLIEPDEMN